MEKNCDSLGPFLLSLEVLNALYSMDFWFKDADGNFLVGASGEDSLSETGQKIALDTRTASNHLHDVLLNHNHDLYFGPTLMHHIRTEQGTFCIYETELFKKDGSRIGILGYKKDITQEVLLSNFPGFAYRSIDDAENTMTFISEGCREMTGYGPEDFYAKNPSFYDLIREDYRAKLLKQWENELKPGEIGNEIYPIITAAGETKWLWEQYTERKSSEEIYMATEGFVTDITAKKFAEEALMDSEERFRTIFEKAPLGIGIFSTATGAALHVNNKFCEMLGLTQDEILDTSWVQYSHPDDIEPNLRYLEVMERTGRGFTMDKRYYNKNGDLVWVNMIIVPLAQKKGEDQLHLAMFVDITDRKKAEEEILYLSYHDALTGLYNRRYYELALTKLDAPANLPLSIIVADVDGLKKINDTHGHHVGDEVIKVSAQSILNNLREKDVVARIGGDEFIIILPKTKEEDALLVKDRIDKAVKDGCLEGIACSISMGLATKHDMDESIGRIFTLAEDRMYKCKQKSHGKDS